jgi:tripartite-type tricarboxylate transporter receptor subunit TctC
LKDPETLKALRAQGLDALGGSPDDFARFIKSETERWARVIHEMHAAKEK